jgi:hypothetical protein
MHASTEDLIGVESKVKSLSISYALALKSWLSVFERASFMLYSLARMPLLSKTLR